MGLIMHTLDSLLGSGQGGGVGLGGGGGGGSWRQTEERNSMQFGAAIHFSET